MIGIIYVGDVGIAPYAKKYTDTFSKNNIDYEIIQWDRDGNNGKYDDNVHTFSCTIDRFGNKIKRVIPYLRFSLFIRRIIRKKKYDKLVILTTQSALIIADVLLGKYKGRYYFDYRDTSHEYLKPYSMLINRICNNAAFVSVSSPGFLEYIKTNTRTLLSHNFQNKYYAERQLSAKKRYGEKIVVGYVGILREYEYLVKLADIFGQDSRFQLDFYGVGDDIEGLRDYCSKYDNVNVMGAYAEKDKRTIIAGFDIICYNYPYSFVNYPAIANKLYDGLICKKPLFTNSRTFSGKIIAENGLGISIDQDDDKICDKIFEYYSDFDPEEFALNCEKYLEKVVEDEKEYQNSIEEFSK